MAKATPIAKVGRPTDALKQKGSHDYHFGNRGSDYIASRIKRDRPDIAETVERGEFGSRRHAGTAELALGTRAVL